MEGKIFAAVSLPAAASAFIAVDAAAEILAKLSGAVFREELP